MGSTVRGVTPHKTKGDYYVQPGTNFKPQTHERTSGLHQQEGNPMPMGQQAPVIDKTRING
jgi:hypothetical protein